MNDIVISPYVLIPLYPFTAFEKVSVINGAPAGAVKAGTSIALSLDTATAAGYSYQWFLNDNPIQGATGGSYTPEQAPGAGVNATDAGTYSVQVTDQSGTTGVIFAGNLAVTPFSSEPQSQTVSQGSTAVFSVTIAGSYTYQWQFNGVSLADGNGVFGSTTSQLMIAGATATNAGSYACTVTNSAGSATSSVATLAVVNTTNPGRLINISCRAQVGTGGNILIAGFAIGGAGTSGSESLLVRGSGPALVPFGVVGTLPDPQLQLYSGSTLLGTNDGWAGNAQIASAASSVGAFAWPNPSSHDSGLLETLPSGPYTAQISGQTDDTGVALAEVYDDTPVGTYTPASPRLINISARVQVGKGAGSLIAGFVIGGMTAKTVLIRASGPALIPFGVPGTLPDPQLQLNNSTGVIATNTGWAGNPLITTVATSVGAFSWPHSATLDSALLVTLPPGAYTAQVTGTSGDTGVALVEVYEVQ